VRGPAARLRFLAAAVFTRKSPRRFAAISQSYASAKRAASVLPAARPPVVEGTPPHDLL
jgi:hypothetical protein